MQSRAVFSQRIATIGFALFVAIAAPGARAADGRIEINQAAATAAGGFPYTISQPGSYLLTSDLVVAVANTSGIVISASPVTLDLNGFAVRGPVTCSRPAETFYDATTITCTATDNGYGITGGTGNTIRNGAVKGFGRYGIFAVGGLTSHAIVEDMRVEQNAQGGIYFSNGNVRRVNVTLNAGASLIHTNAGGQNSSVSGSQIYRNGGSAIDVMSDEGGNNVH